MGERDPPSPLAPLFVSFFFPLDRPYVNWSSQECSLSHLMSSLRSSDLPLFYFHRLFLCSSWLAAGRRERERDQHIWSWPPCCILQPKIHICWSVWGLVLKTWASADRLGERTEAGCTDSPKRLECGPGCNGMCAAQSIGRLQKPHC